MKKGKTIQRNSQILFIYDAKMSNPNGDMDNENKPRMDYDTSTNLVTDVRLKRYLRDYFETVLKKEIFVTEKAEKAQNRTELIVGKGKVTDEKLQNIIDTCFDIKFFGVVLGTTGGNTHLTGPVQFNWGYSLNPVEINESSTITSSFSSGEGVGKDFRVKYSLIAFDGSINAHIAKHTKLTDGDLITFDKAMIKAIPFSRTRSKTGQTPRLYIRIETGKNCFLKDFREYVKLDYKVEDYKVRDITEFKVDINSLRDYLEINKNNIYKIYYWQDENLSLKDCDEIEEYLRIKDDIVIEKVE